MLTNLALLDNACLIREDINGSTSKENQIFGTMTQQLREVTEVCWVPVWNVLEGAGLQLVLINPEHYKAVRGKKTELKDGKRIAELPQDGRLEGSYPDLGPNSFDQRLNLRTTKGPVKRLEALGHKVALDSPMSSALNPGGA